MTSSRAIATSALATTMISLLAASIVTSALPPDISTVSLLPLLGANGGTNEIRDRWN